MRFVFVKKEKDDFVYKVHLTEAEQANIDEICAEKHCTLNELVVNFLKDIK